MDTGTILLMDIGITLVAATIFGFIARALHQPLILAYVLSGVAVGPSFFRIITEADTIDVLAQFGIALLLSWWAGTGSEEAERRWKGLSRLRHRPDRVYLSLRLPSCGLYGLFRVCPVLYRIQPDHQLYNGCCEAAFRQNEMDTLHGEIVLGVLLVQDIVTILVLATLPTLGSFSPSMITGSILTGIGLVSFAIVSSRYLLPFCMKMAAKSVELLFLFSLSWCFIFASFTYLTFLTLLVKDSPQFALNSISIGSFLAGLSLASFPYNIEIIGRVRPLKDFFLTLFFASLGMQITVGVPAADFSSVQGFLHSVSSWVESALASPVTLQVLVFSLYVLLGSVVIMMVITALLGYGKRTSFMTAVSLAQISEFSLILAVQGQALGHISQGYLR